MVEAGAAVLSCPGPRLMMCWCGQLQLVLGWDALKINDYCLLRTDYQLKDHIPLLFGTAGSFTLCNK